MSFSYKTSITFGLVYIPIKLSNVIKTIDIGFNMIDKKTNSRIAYKKISSATGEEVKQENIIKGYEYEKDRYVIFENEDFEKIKTPKDKSITIESFVDISEIDPKYYQKSYYVIPEGAEKAFVLLKESMKKENKIGIAKSVLGSKENLIALRINGDDLILNTMYFHSEIQKNPIKDISIKVNEKELDLAQLIINSMVTKFEPDKYINEYNSKLQDAIEEKINGKEISIPRREKDVSNLAVDLMDALQKTLEQNKVAVSG